jgi:DNA-binding IclR family transcriptional regulator
MPAMTKYRPAQNGVQVIERAARILRELAEFPDEGLSLASLAQRAGLARSTVHRLVTALQAEAFVVPASPGGRVKLGPGLVALAVIASPDLVREIHPWAARLSHELDETVDISVLQHNQVLFVDQVAAPRRLRAVSAVGSLFPAHSPAPGKALLSALPDERVVELLPVELESLTPSTITRRDDLIAELEVVRQTGIAYDREEHTPGICAVAGVVRDATGRMASISVPLPAQRFYGHEQELAKTVLRTCDEVDRALS